MQLCWSKDLKCITSIGEKNSLQEIASIDWNNKKAEKCLIWIVSIAILFFVFVFERSSAYEIISASAITFESGD